MRPPWRDDLLDAEPDCPLCHGEGFLANPTASWVDEILPCECRNPGKPPALGVCDSPAHDFSRHVPHEPGPACRFWRPLGTVKASDDGTVAGYLVYEPGTFVRLDGGELTMADMRRGRWRTRARRAWGWLRYGWRS